MKNNILSLHSSCVGSGNLLTLIAAAKHSGFKSIEPNILQVDAFLEGGFTIEDFKKAAVGLNVAAMGWLEDCDRQGDDYIAMMCEAEDVFSKAASIGAESVQITNGPVDYRAVEAYNTGKSFNGYMGLLGRDMDDIIRLTGKNLRDLADLAAQAGLTLYLEPLGWTPSGKIKNGVDMCRVADRPNMKIMIDFWHGFVAGDTPDYVSHLDASQICGVHLCDGLPFNGGIPVETVLRDVALGEGVIPISEWVAAVKATGYCGWWTYETFSKHEMQREPFSFASEVYSALDEIVNS